MQGISPSLPTRGETGNSDSEQSRIRHEKVLNLDTANNFTILTKLISNVITKYVVCISEYVLPTFYVWQHLKKKVCFVGCAQTLLGENQTIGKIHIVSIIAVTFEPIFCF